MKIQLSLLLSGLCLSFTAIRAAEQMPLYDFDFDQAGTIVSNAGSGAPAAKMYSAVGAPEDLHGAPGSGVSSAGMDISFDNAGATGMGAAGTGGLVQTGDARLEGLVSFTLLGWFKTGKVPIDNNARLFDYGNGAGFTLYAPKPGMLALSVNHAKPSAPSEACYASVNEWIFFAVSYDGKSVRYYKGSKTDAASLISTAEYAAGAISPPKIDTLGIGNPSTGNSRPVAALLDNFRIYGSTSDASGALSLNRIQRIQQSAMKSTNH